jgi:hypothetical protein
MASATYGSSPALVGNAFPVLWHPRTERSWFGDVAVVVFLLAQCFDGVFTYVGVVSYGIGIEANPVVATLMVYLGHGAALVVAKALAAGLGIVLHLGRVHLAVALLAVFYIVAAVVPWAAILLS